MIVTVTMNPALDYAVRVGDFRMGFVNRTEEESLRCGGKGINVSAVLKNLGLDSLATGFLAGFTGDEIERRLAGMGIRTDFVRTAGMSRINIKLRSSSPSGTDTETETEINARGPEISEENLCRLTEKLDRLSDGDVLVLAGAVPDSMPDDVYARILARLAPREVRVVVDAAGELLGKTLPYRPFLVKPNLRELGELFGAEIGSAGEAERYACELRRMGAKNVIVSMAGEGALMAAEDGEIYRTPAPNGRVVDSVGAGDSLVAGFLAGTLHGMDPGSALRLGVAAGSASAFSKGLAAREEVDRLYRILSPT